MFAIMAQAFIALFVTVDPVGNMPLFLSLTAEADAAHRRRMALQGPAVATVVLVVFALAGEPLLRLFGITLPAFRIAHMVTPAESTEYGMKGMGEGGAIAPPAAVANAIRDALLSAGIDAEISETPMTPKRVYDAIRAAKTA